MGSRCDETKPECLRCSNFGRKCEGYPSEDEEPKKETPPLSTRRLVAKAVQETSIQDPPISAAPSNILPWYDDLEYQYFCIFRDYTVVELSGGFEPTIWTRIVIQACDNIAIRELTTAVAALGMAYNQFKDRPARLQAWDGEESEQTEMKRHRQYALLRYGRGLKRIQEMVSTGQDSSTVALITALLIFVFENMHGDTYRAVRPMKSALELIVRLFSTPPQQQHGSFPVTKPLQTWDREFVLPFIRQDSIYLTLLSERHHQHQESIAPRPNCFYTMETLLIPSTFTTIAEARLYLDDMKWRMFPNEKVIRRAIGKTPLGLPMLSSGFVLFPTTLQLWCTGSTTSSPASLISLYSQWQRSFAPLLEYSRTMDGASMFVPATILHIQALWLDLAIVKWNLREPSLAPSTECFNIACSIISLSKSLVESPSFSKGFVFDSGIIPTLATILMQPWDRALKLKACEVVKTMVPRREGIWDSKVVLDAAYRMFAKEDNLEPPSGEEEAKGTPSWTGDLETTLLEDDIIDLSLLRWDTKKVQDQDGLDVMIDPRLLIPERYASESPPIPCKSSDWEPGGRRRTAEHLDPNFIMQFLVPET
jgi:hypothetical protein